MVIPSAPTRVCLGAEFSLGPHEVWVRLQADGSMQFPDFRLSAADALDTYSLKPFNFSKEPGANRPLKARIYGQVLEFQFAGNEGLWSVLARPMSPTSAELRSLPLAADGSLQLPNGWRIEASSSLSRFTLADVILDKTGTLPMQLAVTNRTDGRLALYLYAAGTWYALLPLTASVSRDEPAGGVTWPPPQPGETGDAWRLHEVPFDSLVKPYATINEFVRLNADGSCVLGGVEFQDGVGIDQHEFAGLMATRPAGYMTPCLIIVGYEIEPWIFSYQAGSWYQWFRCRDAAGPLLRPRDWWAVALFVVVLLVLASCLGVFDPLSP